MSVIAADVIRSLAGFKADHAPVTSCYIDVDGRRFVRQRDLDRELDHLLRDARGKANGHDSVHRDLSRIEALVRGGIDRSRTRGLAIFSCTAHDLWEVIPLPVPVQNRVVINHVPAVSQLEAVLEDSEAMGVLLADRQRARVFVFELGELTERSERFDELPRDYDVRGEKDQGDVAAHVDALAAQHLRRAADAAFAVFKEKGFEHLAIAAPEEIAGTLEGLLHPYLRQRLCGRLPVTVTAGIDDIRSAAMDMELRVERRKEADEVDRLREAVATGRRGVAGLAGVLEALHERRVERLLVSQGYREEGWRCPTTGELAAVGPTSHITGAVLERIDDVVEEAVEAALAQGCRVEICVGNADLDVLGRIGALLRY
ncbi:MAG: hypothetical protein ABIV94_05455 [Acidimicrobiales bacterium]